MRAAPLYPDPRQFEPSVRYFDPCHTSVVPTRIDSATAVANHGVTNKLATAPSVNVLAQPSTTTAVNDYSVHYQKLQPKFKDCTFDSDKKPEYL